ncbi:MAG: hypothetical protein WBW16_06045 [Bacteroidota bacterium]
MKPIARKPNHPDSASLFDGKTRTDYVPPILPKASPRDWRDVVLRRGRDFRPEKWDETSITLGVIGQTLGTGLPRTTV